MNQTDAVSGKIRDICNENIWGEEVGEILFSKSKAMFLFPKEDR